MELEISKSGLLTLKYNNKYLHSKYDPKRESQQFINGYKKIFNDKTIVVYGAGLGYHLKELLEVVNNECIIYVFENNLDIIEYCKRVNEELFYNSKIKFILKNDVNFYEKLSDKIKEVKDIIIHKPSLETIKDDNKILYQILDEYIISKNSIEKFAEIMNDNVKKNDMIESSFISDFISSMNTNNKDYIVVAAGPSLDYDIERLRIHRERFIIFSVGSALRTLVKNQIIPDAIVIIDSSELVYNQIKGYEDLKVPLCFLSTASALAVEKYNGPKYKFYNDKDENNITTGKTVAIPTLDLSIKCGAKNIVMLGQDLACIDGKSHTSTFREAYGKDDYGQKFKNNEMVKSYDGKMISTNKGYLVFKRQIERLINENQKVNFFNCSKGVYIEGSKHISFREYLNRKRE